MASDLSFWKYEKAVNCKPYAVYVNLSAGKPVPDVAKLPIEKIRAKVDERFSEWEKSDDNHLEFNNEMIEIFTTDQFVRFDCYSVSEDNMNKLIDIMLEFDCRLYDSSIDVRFD